MLKYADFNEFKYLQPFIDFVEIGWGEVNQCFRVDDYGLNCVESLYKTTVKE